MLIKDEGICIRAADYSETSQIVVFFTKHHGKISTIAKGARRNKNPFSGPIEPLSLGNVVFTAVSEKLATLTEFDRTARPAFLSKDLFGLNCAVFAAEIVNDLTEEHDSNELVFESIVGFLNGLGETADKKNRKDKLVLLIIFQINLLKHIGQGLILQSCCNCRMPFSRGWGGYYFSSQANGLVCRDCELNFTEKLRITEKAAEYLANLNTIILADERVLSEIEKAMIYHFTELLHRPPRMAKHILKD